ncbi:DNA cytosine methyltransferase, partial [Ornithinimicrobium cerasi]|uniref:DNA cytosine methyltransferase n=1 Tax=Ornithinimicrobium cerasi TaxID=2248773 RepID=UPI001482A0BF
MSLYSGAGGFDLGFAGVGISNIAAFDNDPAALKTHKANHPDTQVVSADLSFVRPSTLLGPTQASNIDILTLGPPCQGFSHMAGPRFDDERNHHLKNASLHILDLFPKVAIIENVTGSITKRHKWIWEALEQHLRTSGYRTQLLAIDMERLGLPQSRRRALLVAWRTPALNFALPRTSRLKPLSSALETYPSGNNSSHSLKPGSRTWHIAKQILPGQRLTNSRLSPKTVQTWAIPEAFGSTSVEERHILRSMVRLRRRDRARTWGDADPVALHIINASLGFDASTKINDLIARGYIRRNGDRFDLRHTFNGK